MAYILGYLFAEGNINISKNRGHRKALQVESKDREILSLINKELGKNLPPRYRKRIRNDRKTKTQESFYITICSQKIVDDLIKHGLAAGKKSAKIKLPLMPEKYVKDFTKGYFDGDGSAYTINDRTKYKNKTYSYPRHFVHFTSKSLNFLKELNSRLNLLGKIYSHSEESNAYILRFSREIWNRKIRISLE
ncbi:hypothetical protein ES703_06040 [subsurface metagenome]